MHAEMRRTWRLYPLKARDLLRVQTMYTMWARTYEGARLGTIETAVDAQGKKVCGLLIKHGTCQRVSCPYSHSYPVMKGPHLKTSGIGFLDGFFHVICEYQSQTYFWRNRPLLQKLFNSQSSTMTMVSWHDPMTLGRHGAEVIRTRDLQDEELMSYTGFVEVMTQIREHELGLVKLPLEDRPELADMSPREVTELYEDHLHRTEVAMQRLFA
ncbi:unnamed protein product [Chrysoparadoxa australica]